MNIKDPELIDKIRTDNFMNQIYNYAQAEGLTEQEMLRKTVIILLNLKEKALQHEIDKLLLSPPPFLNHDNTSPEKSGVIQQVKAMEKDLTNFDNVTDKLIHIQDCFDPDPKYPQEAISIVRSNVCRVLG